MNTDQDIEVITGKRGWSNHPVAPWRRYGARMLDTPIHGLVGFFVISFIWYSVAPDSADRFFALFEGPGGRFYDLFLTVAMAGLVGSVVVGLTGSSLGKLIFGIRVVDPADQRPIGVGKALEREVKVWLNGLGCGIPIVSLITLWYAYDRLTKEGSTSWDSAQHNAVLHRPNGGLQYALNAVGIILVLLLVAMMRLQ